MLVATAIMMDFAFFEENERDRKEEKEGEKEEHHWFSMLSFKILFQFYQIQNY